MLMDRSTLLDHRDHWVTEPSATAVALDRLDQAESAVYAELISNAYGPSSDWNKNGSASPPSRKQSPSVNKKSM
jgi:hypothetical protein